MTDPLFRVLGTMLAMGGGDTSLELVGTLTDALLDTPPTHWRRSICAAIPAARPCSTPAGCRANTTSSGSQTCRRAHSALPMPLR